MELLKNCWRRRFQRGCVLRRRAFGVEIRVRRRVVGAGTVSSLVLNGGALATNGFSQTNTLKSLVLSANSTIDMGAIGASVLKFGNSNSNAWSGSLTV